MILLLDANALFWALDNPTRLDASVRASISDPVNAVLVSAATIWELEIKVARGRIRLPADLLDSVDEMPAEIVPVLGTDARTAARLPMHHRDPFDRMLVAQAQRLGAVVVSADSAFDAYGISRLAPLGGFIEEADLDALLDDEQLPLPPAWQRMADGRPMPNVVRAIRLSRSGR